MATASKQTELFEIRNIKILMKYTLKNERQHSLKPEHMALRMKQVKTITTGKKQKSLLLNISHLKKKINKQNPFQGNSARIIRLFKNVKIISKYM